MPRNPKKPKNMTKKRRYARALVKNNFDAEKAYEEAGYKGGVTARNALIKANETDPFVLAKIEELEKKYYPDLEQDAFSVLRNAISVANGIDDIKDLPKVVSLLERLSKMKGWDAPTKSAHLRGEVKRTLPPLLPQGETDDEQ